MVRLEHEGTYAPSGRARPYLPAGQPLGFARKELVGQGGQQPGAIPRAGIGIQRAAVLQIVQGFQSQAQ